MTTKNTSRRLQQIGKINLRKETVMHALETRIPKVIDLRELKDIVISSELLARAEKLHREGHVHRNPHYSWLYAVSSSQSSEGRGLYFINLATFQCPCLWFQNTGRPCKHLVAALFDHMEITTLRI